MLKTNNNNRYTYNQNFKALPHKYVAVDKYLIRGPHPSFINLYKLKKEGVTQVYDFRQKDIRGFKFLEKFFCKMFGIKYNRKPFSFLWHINPTLNDYEEIAKSVKDNSKNGGKTLFHCNSGRHRTALFSTFYDITKGEKLSDCQKDTNFLSNVKECFNKNIKDSVYYNRKYNSEKSWNYFINLRRNFNNRVLNATKIAKNELTKILLNNTNKQSEL